MKKPTVLLILMLMANTAYAAGPGLSPTTGISAGCNLSRCSGNLSPAQGGTGTSTAFTAGSVVYAGTSGTYSQNNANFFWDNSNVRLGIGTSAPSTSLMVSGATGNNTLTLGPYTGSGSGIIIINNNNSGTLGTGTISGTQTNGMEFNDAQGFNFSTTGLTNPSAHATVQVTGNLAVGSGYVGTTPTSNGMIVQGSVGIGTNVPLAGGPLTINGITTGTNADFLCLSSLGVVLLQTTACTISKSTYKENVINISGVTAMKTIMALKPVKFNMKQTNPKNSDPNFLHPQYGFLAEGVASVDKNLSVFDNDMTTPKSWRQESMIALAISGLQQHEVRLNNIEEQIPLLTEGHFPVNGHKCFFNLLVCPNP